MNKKRFYIISSTFLLIGLFTGIVQYVGILDTLYAAVNNPGHLWSEMECSTAFCIDTANDRVGVGTKTPQTTFDVNGAIKIGESTTCNTGSRGAIRYSGGETGGEISICNGVSWTQMAIVPYPGENFTDPRDGNVYGTVILGGKTWMRENLRYLPSVVGGATGSETDPYYYVHGYNGTDVSTAKATTNFQTYGVLYNWPAATTACPTGWHLPSHDELTDLERAVCTSGTCLTDFPKDTTTTGWRGTDEGYKLKSGGFSDFAALMPGARTLNGSFLVIGYVYFWSSTPSSTSVWSRFMNSGAPTVARYTYSKAYGFSVRCLRD